MNATRVAAMRKVVIQRPGGYDRLRVEEHPDPVAGAGEVAIDVVAIGVNYADCVVRMGLYSSARKYVGWPITPGFEVAGTVAQAGAGIVDLPLGTPVFAVTRFGGYATRVVVPRAQVFAMPSSWTFAQAAAFPTAHLTAWYALFELAHPRPNASVLVHSAAGGVGSALLQLARFAGCRTVAVIGASHKEAHVRALGAEVVVDRSRGLAWVEIASQAPNGYDVVLDANGADSLRRSYRVLAPAGKLVVYGFHGMLPKRGGKPWLLKLLVEYLRTPRFNPLQMTGDNKSVLAFNLSYLFHETTLLRHAMEQLLVLVAEGKLVPPAVTEYALSDVAGAHQALESGNTVGKLVLVP